MSPEDTKKTKTALTAKLNSMNAPAPDPVSDEKNYKDMKRFAEMAHSLISEFPELSREDRSLVLGLAFVQNVADWHRAGTEDLFTVDDPTFKRLLRYEFSKIVVESAATKAYIIARIWRVMFLLGDIK